jgi:hypothetical protein
VRTDPAAGFGVKQSMPWRTVAVLGVVGAIILSPRPAQAQADPAASPVSLARVRAALDAPPPRLLVPGPAFEVPTFRVEVRQDLSMLRAVDEPPFDPTWGLPSAGELMMGGIGKLHSAVSGFKKRRAKGKAKKEVSDALAEFCAVHACPPPAPR